MSTSGIKTIQSEKFNYKKRTGLQIVKDLEFHTILLALLAFLIIKKFG